MMGLKQEAQGSSRKAGQTTPRRGRWGWGGVGTRVGARVQLRVQLRAWGL